jgi:hypothetical protein
MFRPVDLRRDGIAVLKMLPEGAGAMPCITAPFVWLSPSQKEYVLATELYRSAKQSGISIHGLAKEYKNTQETTPLRGSRWKQLFGKHWLVFYGDEITDVRGNRHDPTGRPSIERSLHRFQRMFLIGASSRIRVIAALQKYALQRGYNH